MNYCLTLGLEIHIQVNSATKMFCGCDANIWQAEPNTHTCPTCLGLPGALPVPNFDSVQKTQLLGLALNCRPNKNSHFDRKHYFYPDLPKGYQISQYKDPLCGEGYLELRSGKKALLERIHLEEDTAKSFHEGNKTLIDFNKSGISLIEVVTAPCFTEVADAVDFCKKMQDIVRVLNISDADMEKGNMRLEANISLRTPEMEQKGELANYKVEVKNINSFRFMEKAVRYEIKRQTELLESGKSPKQENRGWDERKGVTVPQRDKEEVHDYRYFPDPDIPELKFTDNYLENLKAGLPELPYQLRDRLISVYKLTPASADFFSTGVGLDLSKKLEETSKKTGEPQKMANLLINRPEFRDMSVEEIITLVSKKIEDTSTGEGIDPTDTIKKVLEENHIAVQNYKAGKQGTLEYLIGQVMKASTVKPNISTLRQKILELLNESQADA